eukprot:Gb_13386 [translate_table: standard]
MKLEAPSSCILSTEAEEVSPGFNDDGGVCWACSCWCSFCRLISTTFLWQLECISFEKVGLKAGLYSGRSLPDLNLTPQALHRVLGPSGPVLHCGVFWTKQWLHLRACEPSWAVLIWLPFFAFLAGGLEECREASTREHDCRKKSTKTVGRDSKLGLL